MVDIIFWICVVCFVVQCIKSRAKKNGSGNGSNMGEMPRIDNRPMQNQAAGSRQQQYYRPQQSAKPQPLAEQKAAGAGEAEAGSTLAYLEEKARQDAREHAREKWEETKRLNANYGGLRAAERRFEGDGIPNGKKCITCAYCGAENLVPANQRERYSCYFCREAL